MSYKVIKRVNSCRVCKNKTLQKVLALGPTPLANAFLTKVQVDEPEYFYPLDVYFCKNCSFVQLGHVVSPQVLFGNYVYVSSTSQVFVNHFRKFAEDIFKKFNLNKDSLVIDIGSNDGILLKPVKELGARVLGIEPAAKIADLAKKSGIETIPEFFSIKLAREIVKKKGPARIITATNVFAHIDDLDEVITSLDVLLGYDGIFILEAPYLVDFLRKKYFDLVYHEHLSYWSVSTLITLFKRFNMTVFDVQKVDAHGGTIRVFVKKHKNPQRIRKSVGRFLGLERRVGLSDINTYLLFDKKIQENKIKLLRLLSKLKSSNKKIIGYGAPAKGNTLLNFFGVGAETLDYVVDDSKWKQGLYTPGKRIPVVPSDWIYKTKPDYILILAWNFASSIIKMHERFKKNGGNFIIPVPKPKII